MIGFWRKRSKTIIIHLVFWPIIAVFIIWGFERAGNPVGGAAAVVNDKTISIAEYRNALQRVTDFYAQMFQGKFDEQAVKMYHVRETALNQVITNELISEQAQKMGLAVSDEEVRQKLLESPMLVKDGKFNRENYDALLRYYHMTPVQFEGELRSSTSIEKTRKLFENHTRPSILQIEKEKMLRDTKADVEFLRLDKEAIAAKISVSDGDVTDFLKSADHEKQVKEYYDLHKATYSTPEQVSAHHILIKATKGNKEEEDAARAKIAKILVELKSDTFENLAKKYSDDPGSKTKGGDLGTFGKGRMVPEFEAAAFSLPVGKISEPVQTSYGFHLLRIDGKKSPSTTSYDSAKSEIAKKLVAQKKVDDEIDAAEKDLKLNPEQASKKLQQLNPQEKWQDTGLFSIGEEKVPKIGDSEDAVQIALSLTKDKPFAQKFLRSGDVVFMLRYKELPKVQNAKVDDEKFVSQLAQEQGREIFYSWSSGLVEKAKIKRNPQLFTDNAPTED